MATYKIDYYHILELRRTCTDDEIRDAYRRLALLCHPDKNPGDENATILFQNRRNKQRQEQKRRARNRLEKGGQEETPVSLADHLRATLEGLSDENGKDDTETGDKERQEEKIEERLEMTVIEERKARQRGEKTTLVRNRLERKRLEKEISKEKKKQKQRQKRTSKRECQERTGQEMVSLEERKAELEVVQVESKTEPGLRRPPRAAKRGSNGSRRRRFHGTRWWESELEEIEEIIESVERELEMDSEEEVEEEEVSEEEIQANLAFLTNMREVAEKRAREESGRTEKKTADAMKRELEWEKARATKQEQEQRARWAEVRSYTMARAEHMALEEVAGLLCAEDKFQFFLLERSRV